MVLEAWRWRSEEASGFAASGFAAQTQGYCWQTQRRAMVNCTGVGLKGSLMLVEQWRTKGTGWHVEQKIAITHMVNRFLVFLTNHDALAFAAW